jgi:anti-sigma regulatory factor (Ser/Thr protein kinase)
MFWIAAACINGLISVAFIFIGAAILRGLAESRQLTKNSLGVAVAVIFVTCSGSHLARVVQMLVPWLDGSTGTQALHSSFDLQLNVVDAATLLALIWYWIQRLRRRSTLKGGAMFDDLQRRFDAQAQELTIKGRVADAFRRALAPKGFPAAPGLSFDASYFPSENDAKVGGDWYDVFALPDRRIGFILGDASGHGIEAAVTSSRVREAIVTTAYETLDPGEVLRRVNAMACHRGLPLVTAVYGTIDVEALTVRYAVAGHPPPVVADRGGSAKFGATGSLPLGVDPNERYRTVDLDVRQGTMLVLYSDGVIEFKRDLFEGERRLLRAVGAVAASQSASPSRDVLLSVFGDNPARDDVALLIVKFLGEPRIVSLPNGRRWSFDVSDFEAATRLRHRVMSTLHAERRLAGDFDAVELILGELLGNVARHTPGAIVVEIDLSGPAAVLTVGDEGPGFAYDPSEFPGDVWRENGRGMLLIESLARRVEVASSPAGTTVRVELPLEPRAVQPVRRLSVASA